MPTTESKKPWIASFIKLQIKDLHGGGLTPEERRLLAGIELSSLVFPGALEEELLRHSLSHIPAIALPARIAAATGSEESELYREVKEALLQGQSEFFLETTAGSLPILQIRASEHEVEPCYHENITFIVERQSLGRQEVGKYGGIFIALDDLKRMEMEYDAHAGTIRFYEK